MPIEQVPSDPRVSVGLPVRNGERYLQQAIDSILGQTLTDLELIISDNASTDGTPEICARALAADSRVHFVRNDRNRGAARNYNRTLALARGRYFKWAAHDDYLAPEYLQRAVEVLDRDAGTVICSAKTRVVGPDGQAIHTLASDLDLSALDRRTRYRQFHDYFAKIGNFRCNPIFGLIRRDALKATRGIEPYLLSDIVLLGELALHGRFQELPDVLFFRRHHDQRAMWTNRSTAERVRWLDPDARELSRLPRGKSLVKHVRAIFRVPMPAAERGACLWTLARSGHWRGLARELRRVVVMMLGRARRSKMPV